MTKKSKENYEITPEQIRIGLYIHMDLGWMDHPFSFNNFKIKDQKQIDTIRSLGLKTLTWDPKRSDVKPLSLEPGSTDTVEQTPSEAVVTIETATDSKKQQYADLRQKISAVEAAYTETISAVGSALEGFTTDPQKAVEQIRQINHEMIETFSSASEISLHMVSNKGHKKSAFCHALNVSVMASAFAYKLGFETSELELIGTGAMLHDVGLLKVPEKIIKNPGPLNAAEITARKLHCRYGLELTRDLSLDKEILQIIFSHHELYDGSGYPDGKKGDEIPRHVRLISLVNHFDNLCNPHNSAQTLTTHDALSVLFRKQRSLFDPELLQGFVRFLGIYPPGSIVSLSNNDVGLVIKVYEETPLRPTLMIYREDIPRKEAMILDLREEMEINVTKAIHPDHLPNDVYSYLSPQPRANYYFDRS